MKTDIVCKFQLNRLSSLGGESVTNPQTPPKSFMISKDDVKKPVYSILTWAWSQDQPVFPDRGNLDYAVSSIFLWTLVVFP